MNKIYLELIEDEMSIGTFEGESTIECYMKCYEKHKEGVDYCWRPDPVTEDNVIEAVYEWFVINNLSDAELVMHPTEAEQMRALLEAAKDALLGIYNAQQRKAMAERIQVFLGERR